MQILYKCKKLFCVIIACYIFIATMFFICFTIKESVHKCTHENCQICYDIGLAKEAVRNKVSSNIIILFFALTQILNILNVNSFVLLNNKTTLINLKTENLN